MTGAREALAATAREVVDGDAAPTPTCRCSSVSASRRRQHAAEACAFADGVIVGSALMARLLEDDRAGMLELAAAFR